MIEIVNPDPLNRGSTIIFEMAPKKTVLRIAHQLAIKTGRAVTVRGKDMIEMHTIPAATIHNARDRIQ